MSAGKDLAYLFVALHEDGSSVVQTPEDVSQTPEGKAANKSAYSDVDQDKVVRFELHGRGHQYAVDLRSGIFEIDGRLFWNGDPDDFPPPQVPLRLVYFRRTLQSRRLKIKDGEVIESLTLEAVRRHFFGWQATLPNGKNVRSIVGLD